VNPEEPLFLGGEFDLTVDGNNRISLPEKLRRMIDQERFGENLVVLMGVNNKPWIYPDKYYRKLMSKVSSQAASAEAVLRFMHSNVSMTFTVPMDKQGRFVLPDKIIRRSHLKDDLGDKTGAVDVTVTGTMDHIEIWRRTEWDSYCDGINSNAEDVALRAKMLMSQFDNVAKMMPAVQAPVQGDRSIQPPDSHSDA
jgi:division/cell wall cluster transcriptional repressor MraZ